MSSPIKITIIIPTRERLQTLRWCLQTVLAQDDDALEIIVSDNFSSDGTEAYVTSLNDSRLRYVNTGRRIGMSQNWEFGLSHASGEWVGFIGDDDGMLPNGCRQLRQLIAKHNVSAIRTRACSYVWPSAQTPGQDIFMNIPISKSNSIRNGKIWISKVAKGTVNYSELPMLYNGGFVKRELLTTFAKKHGKVFLSRIPDVFSGVLIAHLAGRYLYSTESIAINGTSAYSTGYAQFKKIDPQAAVPTPRLLFSQEENLPFHPSIPLMKNGEIPNSLQALVFESMAQLSANEAHFKLPSPVQMAGAVMSAPHSMSNAQLNGWLDTFRRVHNLSPRSIAQSKMSARAWYTFKFLCYRISLIWNSRFESTQELGLSNVFEASNAAGQILILGKIDRLSVLRHAARQYLSARTAR